MDRETARKLARASFGHGGARSDIEVALRNVLISDFPTKGLRNRFKTLRSRLAPDGGASMTPDDADRLAEDIEILLQDFMLGLKISTDNMEGLCPSCKISTKADVLCSDNDRWEYYGLPAMFFSISIIRVLLCQRCTTIYSQREDIESDGESHTLLDFHNPDVNGLPSIASKFRHWRWEPILPEKRAPQRRERPSWLVDLRDKTLKSLLDETYSALKSGLLALSAMGDASRTRPHHAASWCTSYR